MSCLNSLIYLKHPRMVYIIKEHVNLYKNLGVTIGFGSSSSINGLNEMLRCESLPLGHRRDKTARSSIARGQESNSSKLTNLMRISRIEGYNGK